MALRSLTSMIWYLSNTWMLLNVEASLRGVLASTHSFSRSAGHSNISPRDEALCFNLLCESGGIRTVSGMQPLWSSCALDADNHQPAVWPRPALGGWQLGPC